MDLVMEVDLTDKAGLLQGIIVVILRKHVQFFINGFIPGHVMIYCLMNLDLRDKVGITGIIVTLRIYVQFS
jgi:hypothetical protein